MTTLGLRDVQFTQNAIQQFEAIVPRKFRRGILKEVIDRLSRTAVVPTKLNKRLSRDREPFFPGRDVWQLRIESCRFFYEIRERKVVVVFFVGRKGTETTRDMVDK